MIINECHSFGFRVSVSDHVDVCSNVKTDGLWSDGPHYKRQIKVC